MFFRRKYVFESRQTKAVRNALNFLLIGLALLGVYAMICVGFILSSDTETREAQAAFFKRPPDLIVVFTGAAGRIPFALKKANEYRQSHILISGVGHGNTVTSLVTTESATTFGQSNPLDTTMLEIDYLAKNTLENVIETLRYLRRTPGMKHILVISHDYHITRIRTLFSIVSSKSDPYLLHYMAIPSDYANWRNMKLLHKEVLKLVRNLVMLALWDDEIPRS